MHDIPDDTWITVTLPSETYHGYVERHVEGRPHIRWTNGTHETIPQIVVNIWFMHGWIEIHEGWL